MSTAVTSPPSSQGRPPSPPGRHIAKITSSTLFTSRSCVAWASQWGGVVPFESPPTLSSLSLAVCLRVVLGVTPSRKDDFRRSELLKYMHWQAKYTWRTKLSGVSPAGAGAPSPLLPRGRRPALLLQHAAQAGQGESVFDDQHQAGGHEQQQAGGHDAPLHPGIDLQGLAGSGGVQGVGGRGDEEGRGRWCPSPPTPLRRSAEVLPCACVHAGGGGSDYDTMTHVSTLAHRSAGVGLVGGEESRVVWVEEEGGGR